MFFSWFCFASYKSRARSFDLPPVPGLSAPMPAGSEGKAQGLMAMSHQLGFFVGRPIGGLIIDLVHWRGIFFLLFVPSFVGLTLCFVIGRLGFSL